MTETWIFPDWPAPPQVHAAVDHASGAGRLGAAVRSLQPRPAQRRRGRRGRCQPQRAAAGARLCPPRRAGCSRCTASTWPSWGRCPARTSRRRMRRYRTSPARVLAILTADCLPVLFCADDGTRDRRGACRLARAGRRRAGSHADASWRPPPSALLAWLGPCIGAASYEVGEEVRAAFVAPMRPPRTAFVPTRPGHWLCDLCGAGAAAAGGAGCHAHPWRRLRYACRSALLFLPPRRRPHRPLRQPDLAGWHGRPRPDRDQHRSLRDAACPISRRSSACSRV